MWSTRWKPDARSVALHGRDREASRSPRHTATDVRPGRPHRLGLEPAGTTEFLSSVCTSCSFVLRSFYVESPRTAGGRIRNTDNERRKEESTPHGTTSDRRREGRHDTEVGRRQSRSRDCRQGRPDAHRPDQDDRARWLHRHPGHLRQQASEEAEPARGRSLRQGRRRARASGSSSCVSTRSTASRSARS